MNRRKIWKRILLSVLAVLMAASVCVNAFAAVPLAKSATVRVYGAENNPRTYTYEYNSNIKQLDISTNDVSIDSYAFACMVDYSKIKQYPLLLTAVNERLDHFFSDAFTYHEAQIFACSDAILSGKIRHIECHTSSTDVQEYIDFNVKNGRLISFRHTVWPKDNDPEYTDVEYTYENGRLTMMKETEPYYVPWYHYYIYDSKGRLIGGKYESDIEDYSFQITYDSNGYITKIESQGYTTTYQYKNGALSQSHTMEMSIFLQSKNPLIYATCSFAFSKSYFLR